MKPRVLVTETIHQAGWDLLAGETEAVAWKGEATEPLAAALEGAQAAIVRTQVLGRPHPRGETAQDHRQARGGL